MATQNDTTNARAGASPTTYNDWLAFPRWLGFPKNNQRIRWGWENRGGWTDYAGAKTARPHGRASYIHGTFAKDGQDDDPKASIALLFLDFDNKTRLDSEAVWLNGIADRLPTAPRWISRSGWGFHMLYVLDPLELDQWIQHFSVTRLGRNPPDGGKQMRLYGMDGGMVEAFGPGGKPQVQCLRPEWEPPQGVIPTLSWGKFLSVFPAEASKTGPQNVGSLMDTRAFNEYLRRKRYVCGQNLMNNTLTVNGRVVADHIVDRVRSDLAVSYWRTEGGKVDDPKVKPKVKPLEFSANNVAQWLNEACRQPGLGYHPIQDQLRRLPPWDRTPRVDRMIESCFNLDEEQKEMAALASRDLVLGLVCRAMEPGEAWPRMVCLYSEDGGVGKSLMLKLLGGEWYVECMVFPPKPEEIFDECKDAWLVEFGDTNNNGRFSASNRAKMLLSATRYTYRTRYDRAATVHPYGFLFTMTGNINPESALPADNSGLRRYLVVDVERKVPEVYGYLTAWFQANRDQLLAEGLAWFDGGARFAELTDEQRAMQTEAAETHTDTVFWDGLAAFLPGYALGQVGGVPRDMSKGVRLDEVVNAWLNQGLIDFGTPPPEKAAALVDKYSTQIGTTMKQAGWVKKQIRVGAGRKEMRWWPPGG